MPAEKSPSDFSKAIRQLLADAGPDLWVVSAETMAELLGAEKWLDARLNYESCVRVLTEIARDRLRELRESIARERDWMRFGSVLHSHAAVEWHLLILRLLPSLHRFGIHASSAAIQRHTAAAFQFLEQPAR